MVKPTKMRNRQIYKATQVVRSKQISAHLAKNLRSKYKRRGIRIVEGDSVTVKRGEYAAISGKIEKIDTATCRVSISGIKKEKTKGDKFDIMVHASNLLVTGLNLSDSRRRDKIGAVDEHEAEHVATDSALTTGPATATTAATTTTTAAAGLYEEEDDDDVDEDVEALLDDDEDDDDDDVEALLDDDEDDDDVLDAEDDLDDADDEDDLLDDKDENDELQADKTEPRRQSGGS